MQIQRQYPARRYVMVDDKLRILLAMKSIMGERLVTVFPRQGHYANDPKNLAAYPMADHSVQNISDLLAFNGAMLLATATKEMT